MSGAEAAHVLGLISSIISIVEATKQVYDAVGDSASLPKNFKAAAIKLPLIIKLLEDAERYASNSDVSTQDAFVGTLTDCKGQAEALQLLFKKVMPDEGGDKYVRYMKAARTIGKGGRVESLMKRILDDLQLLSTKFPDSTTRRRKDQLTEAIQDVNRMEPSLPDNTQEASSYTNYGPGAQIVNASGGTQYNNTGPGQQYIDMRNLTSDDINHECLLALDCPDTLKVKNRLKEGKDRLLQESIDWILQDPGYIDWMNGNKISLLWIKGGAGKGKTMMSIGLVERLSSTADASAETLVTYSFCQNTDYKLNTLESIIKGMILRLVKQRPKLIGSLRSRWDVAGREFSENVTSWQSLWDIFLEMLEDCDRQRIYIVLDALDECQAERDNMDSFLKCLVRTGLQRPSKIKWLLTSRPTENTEKELLSGSYTALVDLELNSGHVSDGVKAYIESKMDELDRRQNYGRYLRRKIQMEIAAKAEDTYLWVSLACKALESICRDDALTAIQKLPPGLYSLYDQKFDQLHSTGLGQAVVGRTMRLLKAMMLAYRPLNLSEVNSVTGLSPADAKSAVRTCTSFIEMRNIESDDTFISISSSDIVFDNELNADDESDQDQDQELSVSIEFVHQSARDYLAGKAGDIVDEGYQRFDDGNIALNCVSHLSQMLSANLVGLPQLDSERHQGNKHMYTKLATLRYAATFWIRHLANAGNKTDIQDATAEDGEIGRFFQNKSLMWFECLALVGKLPAAMEDLRAFLDVRNLQDCLKFFLAVSEQHLMANVQFRKSRCAPCVAKADTKNGKVMEPSFENIPWHQLCRSIFARRNKNRVNNQSIRGD
ncbi:hypothetical protein AA313_de0201388 [Arthrobotrys entomopaga]|nr:hypothetical protein AA313_de0201388 [Arthrobotrys entomopaga]